MALVASTVLLALTPARWGSALTITINTSNLHANADADGQAPASFQQASPGSVPAFGSLTGSDGDTSSTLVFDLAHDGFEFTFDQLLGVGSGAFTNSGNHVSFRTSVDVTYTLDASFASNGTSATGLFMGISLWDGEVSGSAPLFRNVQYSVATPGEAFDLGGMGGDFDNMLDGSATGVLDAGHLYILAFAFYQESALAGGGTPSRATGRLSFALVPEPYPGVLLALGGAAFLLARVAPPRRADQEVGCASGRTVTTSRTGTGA